MRRHSLRIRPIYVYSENHVRGHVLLCMPAYYVEWQMRNFSPPLFEDDDRNELLPVQRKALDLLGITEKNFWGSLVI